MCLPPDQFKQEKPMIPNASTEKMQQPLPPPIVPEVTLGSLAREALTSADGRVEIAVKRLLYRLRSDHALLHTVLEAAVKLAVEERIKHKVNDDRRYIFEAAKERSDEAQSAAAASRRDNVIALAGGIGRCLLDFPLCGGKRLRDANRAEIMAQIERYEKSAESIMHKSRWLRLVADKVPDGKTVGDVLREDAAQALFEEAKNDE
jgi:hypothetical protein